MNTSIDIICIGEILIDYIGNQTDSLENTKNFEAFVGGSATNVASYAATLGLTSLIVATCGNDDLGDFILQKLKETGVIISQVAQSKTEATSVIYVSRNQKTREFKALRNADYHITDHHIPDQLLLHAKIFHTTCFALSKKPSQETILKSAKKAAELGLKLSIDINYSEKIWADRTEMQQIIQQYLSYNPLVKVSDDDCFRIFNELKSDEEIFKFFHNLGAQTVCLTKGDRGVKVSDLKEGIIYEEAIKIDKIKDTTGAGDAFWTGFLYSKLKEKSLHNCIKFAQELAVIKLQHLGDLPKNLVMR